MNATNFIIFYGIGLAPIFFYLIVYFVRKVQNINLVELILTIFISCCPIVREVFLLSIILLIYNRTIFKKSEE